MASTSEPPTPSDELLRRIGRNVLNFQYLETTLRSMILSLSEEGTLSELQTRQAELVRKHKKSSLGELASAFQKQFLRPPVEEASDGVVSEPKYAFSVQIESTSDDVARRKQDLTKLVIERNRLIHNDLLLVDLSSNEQCEALSARLDEQNTRLCQQLNELNAFRNGLRVAAEELMKYIESDEFSKLLQGEGESNDA